MGAGSGPLLLAVARYLRSQGANVRPIAEQAPLSALLRFGRMLAARPAKLVQATSLWIEFWSVRYLTDCWPVEADGSGRLERVVFHHRGKTFVEPCDFLACGFGLVPNTEVAALLGCAMSKDGAAVDEYQRTSVSGVFAAGEVTGIGGLDLALCEGEIAGYAAAERWDAARGRFAAGASHNRFAAGMERAFALRPELRELPKDQTTVCCCEDVLFAQIRNCSSWRQAKLHTRCGMGSCQAGSVVLSRNFCWAGRPIPCAHPSSRRAYWQHFR